MHCSIGSDDTINFQHKLSHVLQKCAFYFRGFCLRLAFCDPFPSLWVWFIFAIGVLVLICLLYASCQQILKCCQEILQSISHYTSNACHILCNWFKNNFPFQSIWRAPSQASDGSPMLTPNMIEKQVKKLEECLTKSLP